MYIRVCKCCEPKAQQFEPFLAELERLRLIYCDDIENKNIFL